MILDSQDVKKTISVGNSSLLLNGFVWHEVGFIKNALILGIISSPFKKYFFFFFLPSQLEFLYFAQDAGMHRRKHCLKKLNPPLQFFFFLEIAFPCQYLESFPGFYLFTSKYSRVWTGLVH